MPKTAVKSTVLQGLGASQENASKEAYGGTTSSADLIATLSSDLARLSPSSRKVALVRLAGYSIVDFLQAAGDLKLSPQTAAAVLADPSVQQKNQQFFESFRGAAARLCAGNSSSNKEKELLHEIAISGRGASKATTDNFFNPHVDPECGKVLAALDAFYAPLVGMRRVQLTETRNPDQKDTVEWLIEKYERAFEKHQWINVWRDKIEAAFGGVDKTFEALTESERKVLFLKETISEEMLRSIATRAGINMDAPEQQRLLRDNKYGALGVITNLQKDEAFEYLSERLANCLRARGVPEGAVRLEQENGSFVLKENEPDMTARERARAGVTILDRVSVDYFSDSRAWATVCHDRIAYCKHESGRQATVVLGPGLTHTFDAVVSNHIYRIGGKPYAIGKTQGENEPLFSIVSTDGVTPVNICGEVVALLDAPGGCVAHIYRSDGTSVLWRDGQVICEEQGSLKELSIIGGQITYIVEADRRTLNRAEGGFQVVHGAWRSPKLDYVWGMREVGGKLTFAARAMSGGEMLYFNGVPSETFRSVQRDILDVGGKPAYIATNNSHETLVYHGQDCVTTMPRTRSVDLFAVGNEVAVSAWIHSDKPGYTHQVVFRGKPLLFTSDHLLDWHGGLNVDGNGKELLLAYKRELSISEKGLGPNNLIVTHGERRWEHEAERIRIVPGGEQVTYIISDKSSERFVCEGKISEPYARISEPVNVGGAPAFCAKKLDGQYIVRHGERELNVPGHATLIENPEGELTYLVQQDADVNLYVNGTLAEVFSDRRFRFVSFASQHAPGTYLLELRCGEPAVEELVAIHLAQTKAPKISDKLTEGETQLLRQINLVAAPTPETVAAYREERRAQELAINKEPTFTEMMNTFVSKSKGAISNINAVIQESPELFLDLFRAKTTPVSTAHLNAVLRCVAPVSVAAREREERMSGASRLAAPSLGSLAGDSSQREISIIGGDPKVKSDRNLITSSLKTPHFVTQHMLADYGKDGWQMLELPVGATHSLETRVVTCVAHIEPKAATENGIIGSALSWIKQKAKGFQEQKVDRVGGGEIQLPRMLNSEYIQSRVHIRDANGRETPVGTKMGVDGGAHVRYSQAAREVAYSVAVPTDQAMKRAVASVSQSDYERFISRDCHEVSNQIARPFGGLGESSRKFLEQIKDEPPLIRIGKIKDFISERGHYDVDNREVREAAEKRNPTENFGIMEARALELKLDGRAPKGKEFAGVCSDYAMLCVAMLRESGIPAGMITGINIDGKGGGKESAAHAKVFVPWPVAGEKGEYIFLEIEATPAGGPRENRTPTQVDAMLSEREVANVGAEQAEDMKPIESAEAEKIEALSADEIRKMVNGTLEETVNQLLAKMTPENTANIEELLGLALYSGVKPSDEGFVNSARHLRARLDVPQYHSQPPRQDFFEMLTTYVDSQARHIQKDNTEGASDARRAAILGLEYIVERGQCALSQREFATAIAALAYLRSEKMLRG